MCIALSLDQICDQFSFNVLWLFYAILVHLHCIDIDTDVRKVKRLLKPLDNDELKELFEEFGLSDATLLKKYAQGVNVYANDLVRAWILGKDGVLKSKEYPGGATWGNLKKALTELGHGIAEEIN